MSAPLLVADSGPLIALARLDQLVLPSRIFSAVWVTRTVWHEVSRAPRGSELTRLLEAQDEGWLNIVAYPHVAGHDSPFPGLDMGESTAISLALTQQATVLMDERNGRLVATAVGLNVIGTLGLLVRGRRIGLLPAVRPLTDILLATGYHLARPLVEQALADIGE